MLPQKLFYSILCYYILFILFFYSILLFYSICVVLIYDHTVGVLCRIRLKNGFTPSFLVCVIKCTWIKFYSNEGINLLNCICFQYHLIWILGVQMLFFSFLFLKIYITKYIKESAVVFQKEYTARWQCCNSTTKLTLPLLKLLTLLFTKDRLNMQQWLITHGLSTHSVLQLKRWT